MAQKGAWAVKQMQLESELASSGAVQGMQVGNGRDCFCTETLPIISPHLIGPYVHAYVHTHAYIYTNTHSHMCTHFCYFALFLSCFLALIYIYLHVRVFI